MATAPELHEPQIAAARAAAWHQTGDALLTMEAARSWVEAFGLVLFAPRGGSLGAPAPSLVEATLGEARPAATLKDSDTARTLAARLVGEGSAVPLNLLGGPGDLPDFLVSAQAFPFVFTLRGDKGWKRPPETSGAVKVTPLGLRVYELLSEKGPMTIAEIVPEIGREITDSAVARALNELWQILRVIPVLQQGEGETRWELLTARFLKAVKAGANAGQPTALSGLVSLYLAQVYVGSEMEVASFLSPLTARSRVREVLHGLTAARQLTEGVVEGQTVMYIPETLPDFDALSADEEDFDEMDETGGPEDRESQGMDMDESHDEDHNASLEEGEADLDGEDLGGDDLDEDDADEDRVDEGEGVEGDEPAAESNDEDAEANPGSPAGAPERIRSFGAKPGPGGASRSLRGKPLGRGPSDGPRRGDAGTRGPRREGASGAERPKRSYGAGRPGEREGSRMGGDRPRRSFGQGEGGADRFGTKRPAGDRPQRGDRPRFDRPWTEDRPGRSFPGARQEGGPGSSGGSGGFEQRPPRFRQDDGGQRPPRPFRLREGGGDSGPGSSFPRRDNRGEGASRPRWQGGAAAGGERAGGKDRPERPFRARTEGDRPFRPRTEGDRPFRPRPEGDRPFRPRPEGGGYPDRSGSDRPFRPRREEAGPQGGSDRPFRPHREGADAGAERPFRPRREEGAGGPKRFGSGGGRPARFAGGAASRGPGGPPRGDGENSRPPRSFEKRPGKPFGARRPEGAGDRPARPYGAGRPPREGGGPDRGGAGRSSGFADRPRGSGGFRPGGKPGGFRKGPAAGGGFGGGRPGGRPPASGFAPRGKRTDRPEGRRPPEDEG